MGRRGERGRTGTRRRARSCARPKNSLGKTAAWWRAWPGSTGPAAPRCLRKFLSGEARIDSGAARYLNQVHRDDVAAALLHLVASSIERLSAASIVNVADDQPITQRECIRVAGEKMDRSLPARRRAGRANENAARATSGCRTGNCARLVGSQSFRTFRAEWRSRFLPAYPDPGRLTLGTRRCSTFCNGRCQRSS